MRHEADWGRSHHISLGFLGYRSQHRFVADDAECAWLRVDCSRRLNSRIDEVANNAFTNRLGRKFARGAARIDRFLQIHVGPHI